MCKEVAKALDDAIENLQQMLEALEDKNPYAAQTFYGASKNANACIVRAVSDAVAPIRYSGEIQFKWPVRRAIVKSNGISPTEN